MTEKEINEMLELINKSNFQYLKYLEYNKLTLPDWREEIVEPERNPDHPFELVIVYDNKTTTTNTISLQGDLTKKHSEECLLF